MVYPNQHKLHGLSMLPELFCFGFFSGSSFKLHEQSSKMIAVKGYWLLLLLLLKNRYEHVPFNELTQWKQNTPKQRFQRILENC